MIRKMEHVAIMVRDMDQSIRFYSEIFGFNVRLRGSKPDREMAFLYLEAQPDMEIELIQEKISTVEYIETGIVNHLAFTVENIDETIQFLKEKEIVFTSDEVKPTLEGGRMILFHGPNQELLQLVERVK
ncbi:VOC family protein [Niallia endozanthoxylica]|uniref:VOC family protein n=1 Tax=Niallia endozanthoxylica TaxID=2036016 RepID=A0A5J5I228_9BACI|nr:VOC family protein [Niallia endozanthoxylica]KAA9029940.1 VOC family protein [Niallia endozanthoxylica]